MIYTKHVDSLFANGADKAMVEMPEGGIVAITAEDAIRLKNILAEMKRIGLSIATLSEPFGGFSFCDEDGNVYDEEEQFVEETDPAHIKIYESGLIEITLSLIDKDAEITTDPCINLEEVMAFFNLSL